MQFLFLSYSDSYEQTYSVCPNILCIRFAKEVPDIDRKVLSRPHVYRRRYNFHRSRLKVLNIGKVSEDFLYMWKAFEH